MGIKTECASAIDTMFSALNTARDSYDPLLPLSLTHVTDELRRTFKNLALELHYDDSAEPCLDILKDEVLDDPDRPNTREIETLAMCALSGILRERETKEQKIAISNIETQIKLFHITDIPSVMAGRKLSTTYIANFCFTEVGKKTIDRSVANVLKIEEEKLRGAKLRDDRKKRRKAIRRARARARKIGLE